MNINDLTYEELGTLLEQVTKRRNELAETQRRDEWNRLVEHMEAYIHKWNEAIEVEWGGDIIFLDAPITTTCTGQIQAN